MTASSSYEVQGQGEWKLLLFGALYLDPYSYNSLNEQL